MILYFVEYIQPATCHWPIHNFLIQFFSHGVYCDRLTDLYKRIFKLFICSIPFSVRHADDPKIPEKDKKPLEKI